MTVTATVPAPRLLPHRAVRAVARVRAIAWPPLVQLVLRVALSVPFWKSGRLKWNGFFHLSDSAVALFTDAFQLHLPGGPYPYPAPLANAFAAGCLEVAMPAGWPSVRRSERSRRSYSAPCSRDGGLRRILSRTPPVDPRLHD